MPSRLKRVAYALALSATVIAIGCGGDDDDGHNNAERYDGEEAEVATVVDDFGDAGRDGDGERICEEIFMPELEATIERQSGQSCASEVEGQLPEGEYEVEVEDIDVQEERATAEVTEAGNRSVLHFVRSDDEWRVIGVTPPLTR